MEKLILELPPSVNRSFFISPNVKHLIHTQIYNNYMEYGTWIVKLYCKRNKIDPVQWYRHVDIDWYLKDIRTDSHNLKKALFDCMERGGLFFNDRYIMDRTQKVVIDKKNPRVEIQLGKSLESD